MPDIEIEAVGGEKTKIIGLPIEKTKEFVDNLGKVTTWPDSKPKGDAKLPFKNVVSVKKLRKNGTVDHIIWAKNKEKD